MLVLLRRVKESIRIGERIRVTLVKMERTRVKVRIEADRNISIDRDELPPLGQAGQPSAQGLGALVLTRHPGESIRIGEGVILTIVAIERSRVRIGVDAGPNVVIDREEIYFRKLRGRGLEIDPVFGASEFEEEEPALEERTDIPERSPLKMIWSGSRYSPIAHVPVTVKRRKAICR